MNKKVINATTGEVTTVVLTAAEVAEFNQRTVDHDARIISDVADVASRAGKKTAALAKLGITEQEFIDITASLED